MFVIVCAFNDIWSYTLTFLAFPYIAACETNLLCRHKVSVDMTRHQIGYLNVVIIHSHWYMLCLTICLVPLLEISLTSTAMKTWIIGMWLFQLIDVITLKKLPFKSWHGWVFILHIKQWMITYPCHDIIVIPRLQGWVAFCGMMRCRIDLIHKSDNAPVQYSTKRYFVTEMHISVA